MDILRTRFAQHQFIIATHSPTVISALGPSTILMIGQDEGESTVSRLDPAVVEHQRRVLNEVGATLSDVHGAEHVFWVEGATEAECFPLIARQFVPETTGATVFRPLRATGDLLGKQGKVVFEIYERLTQGSTVIPPAIAFEFDGERWTEQQRADIVKRSKYPVLFLQRRTYENYLLNAAAIANLTAELEGFSDPPVTIESVQQFLDSSRGQSERSAWLANADAPRLLDDFFTEASGGRWAFWKIEHSVRLTEWILEHSPEELREIAMLIARGLKALKA